MTISRSDILRWALPVGLAICALSYTFYRRFEIQYWDSAVGNWLATLLGIVTGVPVALYLERRRSSAELTSKQSEADRIRNDMLTLLLGELYDALSRLGTRVGLKDTLPIDPMKTSIWNAMRDSGNLVHISEPGLISALSDAYRLIAILNERERHIMQVMYGVNVQFPDGETAGQKLLKETTQFYAPTIKEIQHAVEAIATALGIEIPTAAA